LGTRLKATLPVIRLVTHQHDQMVALGLGLGQRPRDQGPADAGARNGGSIVSGPSSSALAFADAHRREPHRSDLKVPMRAVKESSNRCSRPSRIR